MRMVKCIVGHKYNAEKFNQCPHCATKQQVVWGAKDTLEQHNVDTEEPNEAIGNQYEIIGRRKVVGCLVCVKGSMRGEGFFLVEGHNDIGRGANLEIVLSKELTVSRKAHACIIYNSEKREYIFAGAQGKQDVSCNGKKVENPVLLEHGAMLQIGQCVLRFMAFCDEKFDWEI